jgi:hypothetical protein
MPIKIYCKSTHIILLSRIDHKILSGHLQYNVQFLYTKAYTLQFHFNWLRQQYIKKSMYSGSFVNCTLLILILYSCYPLSVTYRIHIYVYLCKDRGLCFLHLIYCIFPLYALSLSVRTYFYKIPLPFLSVTSLLYRFPKFQTADQ